MVRLLGILVWMAALSQCSPLPLPAWPCIAAVASCRSSYSHMRKLHRRIHYCLTVAVLWTSAERAGGPVVENPTVYLAYKTTHAAFLDQRHRPRFTCPLIYSCIAGSITIIHCISIVLLYAIFNTTPRHAFFESLGCTFGWRLCASRIFSI